MTRRFDASPERVFAACVDPELTRQWLFASASDETYSAEIDARAGGAWTITARREGVDYTASGEYLEIDRPHRLVFTFAMFQFSPNSDTITVEIVPDGAGSIMTFTQAGIDIADELRQTPEGEQGGSEQGWGQMFNGLAAVLAA
ncbi:MAG: SRPBCC domain-containing protein [Chloroflexia bacterium]|nr:SRPBCC domain-containing protein [Chloroflexia bacterium]